MLTSLPEISKYTEYRKYLRDAYLAHKSFDRKFSHRFITRKMGIPSPGWFADVLACRQSLKTRDVHSLAALFKLNAKEREFLGVLVELEHACTQESRKAAHEKWFKLKGIQKEKITQDRFKYFDKWYYPVLYELLLLEPFQGDYAALAAKVSPPIRPSQAKKALQSLVRLGLLVSGTKPRLSVLIKDTSVQPQRSHELQLEYMRLAPIALKHFNKEQRNFSALTLGLSAEGLKKAGEEIAALRSRLLMLSENATNKNRVYQCLFQIFPISEETNHV